MSTIVKKQIKRKDFPTLESEESVIDTLLQCSAFETYFPEVAAQMLEIKKGVYAMIQEAEIID